MGVSPLIRVAREMDVSYMICCTGDCWMWLMKLGVVLALLLNIFSGIEVQYTHENFTDMNIVNIREMV